MSHSAHEKISAILYLLVVYIAVLTIQRQRKINKWRRMVEYLTLPHAVHRQRFHNPSTNCSFLYHRKALWYCAMQCSAISFRCCPQEKKPKQFLVYEVGSKNNRNFKIFHTSVRYV